MRTLGVMCALALLTLTGCGDDPGAAAACGVRDIRSQAPAMPDAGSYVGLTLDAAAQQAERAGAVVVVLGEDGDCVDARPSDLRGDRLNVYAVGGRVSDAAFG